MLALDGLQRLGRGRRKVFGDVRGEIGLDVDGGLRVGDDIMQFAGDPPFGIDAATGLFWWIRSISSERAWTAST
ncbi:MAG TPA: hypothetical protein VJ914_36740 [Pseudonocardiaceae bacterium]|nr:hypothetical protein [Pseudonocardiaceae bacterium]